ncbi:hypothetical protein [Deinococcus sp. QL22]|nr:hypothetical protein [Deinococcus sp. QL22]UQN06800.1 hypothetical protein M1R55_02430 [Deinococcus sp. QL22]
MNRSESQRHVFQMAYTVALTQPVVGWGLGLTAFVSSILAVLVGGA